MGQIISEYLEIRTIKSAVSLNNLSHDVDLAINMINKIATYILLNPYAIALRNGV